MTEPDSVVAFEFFFEGKQMKEFDGHQSKKIVFTVSIEKELSKMTVK